MEYGEIIDDILSSKVRTKDELQRAKIEYCKKYSIENLPTDADILACAPSAVYDKVKVLLRKKPSRTISGVAVIAVMTSPADCPHGKCIYCPGGVEYGTAQSYTGREPAALRAAQHDFDPYEQARARLKQLKMIGHSTDKIDLIIMGGTFTSRAQNYQEWFIKRCFDALNGKEQKNLEEAQLLNENAKSRCIGLTVETRPDWFMEEHIDQVLGFGATRVELGVQILSDEILERVKRGHGIKEIKRSTQLAKDAGMKICYHVMPGLPHSSYEKDLTSFKQVFHNDNFRPDMLKIYPTLIIEGTELYRMLKADEYTPYDMKDMVRLIAEMKKNVPRWVRIQRIQRDIPAQLIVDGVKKGHLRQLVKEHLKERDEKCPCIRCREIGRRYLDEKGNDDILDNIELLREDYDACYGKEIFLSFEDVKNDLLIGYARLRRPSEKAHRKEVKNSGIIRELKVFGQMVPIDEAPKKEWQHRGYGKALIEECERIVKDEWQRERILVMSGVGTRNYYRKFDYKRYGVYMGKEI
jgi:elongator complex protein 3